MSVLFGLTKLEKQEETIGKRLGKLLGVCTIARYNAQGDCVLACPDKPQAVGIVPVFLEGLLVGTDEDWSQGCPKKLLNDGELNGLRQVVDCLSRAWELGASL